MLVVRFLMEKMMSTTECRECKKQVAHMADACPHCGAKSPALPSGVMFIIYFIAGLVGVWVWFYLS